MAGVIFEVMKTQIELNCSNSSVKKMVKKAMVSKTTNSKTVAGSL